MGFELIPSLGVSASGMEAERARMNVVAHNLSNVNSTRSDEGGVFKRRELVFSAIFNDATSGGKVGDGLGGVKIDSMVKSDAAPNFVYAPYHPDAGKDGMLAMPCIEPIREMVDMINASRNYENNLTVIKNSRQMAENTLKLGRGT